MSYDGLCSGLYARIRDYAALLDEILIGIKAGTSSPSDGKRQKLAQLFLGDSPSQPSNLSAQLFQMFLCSDQDIDRKLFREIGQALMSTEVEPGIIKQLEMLARGLEHERAGVFAKMRGRS